MLGGKDDLMLQKRESGTVKIISKKSVQPGQEVLYIVQVTEAGKPKNFCEAGAVISLMFLAPAPMLWS